jgi:threonine-phosphate decarboxylase
LIKGHGGNIYDLARRLGCRPADIVDLSSNVNPLGPPPGLGDYLSRNMDAIAALPEVDNRGIIQDYAGMLGVSPDRLIAGNGTTQFIYSLPAVLKMQRALIVGPTYSDYADACRLHGVPFEFHLCREEEEFQPDIGRIEPDLAGADAVFICNPNNPTAALLPAERLKQLCRRNPKVRFIVDESYLPFVSGGEKQSLVAAGLENVLVLLSISKIYRIPGLRVGFLTAAPAVVAAFAEFIWPWSVNSLAQAAVRFLAQAGPALNEFVAQTRGHLDRQRQELRQCLRTVAGLKAYPSSASFMLIRLPEGLAAPTVWSRLAAEGILIRDCSNFRGLSERFIRVCPKTSETSRRLAERIAELAAARMASGLYGQNPIGKTKHETRNRFDGSKGL